MRGLPPKSTLHGFMAVIAERNWDETLFARDELQQSWLTNSISACFLYPQSEYDSNTHLAHPCTSRGEGIMVSKILAVLIVLTTAASLPSAAKVRGPSTPEERARAVEYVRSLEAVSYTHLTLPTKRIV